MIKTETFSDVCLMSRYAENWTFSPSLKLSIHFWLNLQQFF